MGGGGGGCVGCRKRGRIEFFGLIKIFTKTKKKGETSGKRF